MAITVQQRRFLLDRLNEITSGILEGYDWQRSQPIPQSVKKAKMAKLVAEKIIENHYKVLEVSRKNRDQRISSHTVEIKQIILFGNAEDAIKALDKFQNTKF